MRKNLSTPPKCWLELRQEVKRWLGNNSVDSLGGVDVKKVEQWLSRDYCPKKIVKKIRNVLRAINEKSSKDWRDEIEAFEYWTAGPEGIRKPEGYSDYHVYGVSNTALRNSGYI